MQFYMRNSEIALTYILLLSRTLCFSYLERDPFRAKVVPDVHQKDPVVNSSFSNIEDVECSILTLLGVHVDLIGGAVWASQPVLCGVQNPAGPLSKT